MSARALGLTVATLIAFAANSILCRLALRDRSIDPYTFTAVRIATGAIVLALVTARPARGSARERTAADGGTWRGAAFLAIYALPFSLAYVRLETGTGALLLFGTVQITMIGIGLRGGERPSAIEWIGLAGALGGVVYLVSPGLAAPDPIGALLMILAGVGWGLYSLAGRGARDPALLTAGNFRRAALIVVPAALLALPWSAISWRGALLATASGAIASGLGYVIWYAALRHLTATRAALVQLAVPAIAAAGGVLLLGEPLTVRVVAAGVAVLGSIALATTARHRRP